MNEPCRLHQCTFCGEWWDTTPEPAAEPPTTKEIVIGAVKEFFAPLLPAAKPPQTVPKVERSKPYEPPPDSLFAEWERTMAPAAEPPNVVTGNRTCPCCGCPSIHAHYDGCQELFAAAEPPSDVAERITAYFTGGGLFNPELANHEAVRDLLIDCRAALATLSRDVNTLTVDRAEFARRNAELWRDLAAAREDAEQYRWLRDNRVFSRPPDRDGPGYMLLTFDWSPYRGDPESLDDAINAARKEG